MNKLDNVTTQYRKFNENQVLTEGQLNEFIDYFEDQDRLSRTRLSGVGIACGFKSTSVYGYNPMLVKQRLNISAIAITQGAGVTTDGDLITLRQKKDKPSEVTIDFDAKNYAYYRNYIDEVGYEHFRIGNTQIPLLELITQEEYDQLQAKGVNVVDFRPVAEINNINDKIIILYLESYSNEESPCEDADCDNTGAEQVSNLTVLLADSQSVSDLLTNGNAKDTLYKIHNTYEELFDNLPNLEAKRVILDQSITTAPQLKTRFQNAIGSVSELSEGFNAIANTFNISVNLGGQSLINKLNSLLYTTSPRLEDYQYRYDLLKDLIDTYNEIKGLILHLNVGCNPNISSFPKHLMLGSVGATLELGEHTPFRHGFYNSPVTTNEDENYERIIMLANRFVEKINGFQSYIGPIKITPSNLNVRLGEKAIPYYYNVNKPLLDKWNFEKTKTDRETYNLSYHTTHLAGEDYVQNPLNYSIDNNDFYRIEGHLGLPYKTALQNINDIKTRYGLAFDVITLVLKKGETLGSPPSTKEKTISIENLRKQLVSISSDISNQVGDSQSTLQTISNLDAQLKLLNQADFSSTTPEGVTVLKQDSKKDDVVSELLSEFLERKSGLEHVAGVEPGGTFVLVYESETNNQVLADFSLPYLCCSKKEPVFLVLPASKLCQNDAPIALTIVPLDGEVKAIVNGTTQIPAITQSGGQNFLDPSLVNSAYLGQTITFTVNDDPVEAQMIVYRKPEITSVKLGSVSYATPTTDVNTTDPDATVEFNVVGDFTDLTFTWNFGDGTPIIHNEAPTNKKTHVYNLISGQEETFNPTLTVTNNNGCSNLYELESLKLIGQSTIACLSGMRVVIQYRDGIDGNHECNHANYNLKGNGSLIKGTNPYVDPNRIIKGNIHLSNDGKGKTGTQDAFNYPPTAPSGYTGLDRYNEIIITKEEAEMIAKSSPDGFVEFSLECAFSPGGENSYSASEGCHPGVAYTQLFLANDPNPIYTGYPSGNFLKINPCTGETK